jgi:hypothetical protein
MRWDVLVRFVDIGGMVHGSWYSRFYTLMHHVLDRKENYNYMVIARVSRNISFCKSLWMMYNLFPGGVLHQQFSTMGGWFFNGCSPRYNEYNIVLGSISRHIFGACPKPGSGFPTSYVVVFLKYYILRLKDFCRHVGKKILVWYCSMVVI